jgi:hypothetical protein
MLIDRILGALMTLALVCASVLHGAPAIAGAADERVARGPAQAEMSLRPTPLGESILPLVEAFNADRERARFVAILSPTCGACRHGAEAIARSLLRDGASDVAVFIVWAPMLPPDNEAAARQASDLLEGPGVHQFYDPDRRVGTMFRADVFPRAAEQMLKSLPPDHYLSETLSGRSNDTPEWDIYMFFPRGQEWSDTAPSPIHWIRQVARVADEQEELLSVMWRDSYSQPPIEGSLPDHLRDLAGVIAETK